MYLLHRFPMVIYLDANRLRFRESRMERGPLPAPPAALTCPKSVDSSAIHLNSEFFSSTIHVSFDGMILERTTERSLKDFQSSASQMRREPAIDTSQRRVSAQQIPMMMFAELVTTLGDAAPARESVIDTLHRLDIFRLRHVGPSERSRSLFLHGRGRPAEFSLELKAPLSQLREGDRHCWKPKNRESEVCFEIVRCSNVIFHRDRQSLDSNSTRRS